jgi:hypothetical protein
MYQGSSADCIYLDNQSALNWSYQPARKMVSHVMYMHRRLLRSTNPASADAHTVLQQLLLTTRFRIHYCSPTVTVTFGCYLSVPSVLVLFQVSLSGCSLCDCNERHVVHSFEHLAATGFPMLLLLRTHCSCSKSFTPSACLAVSDMFYRDTFNFSSAVENCKRTWGVSPRSKSWPVTQVRHCCRMHLHMLVTCL